MNWRQCFLSGHIPSTCASLPQLIPRKPLLCKNLKYSTIMTPNLSPGPRLSLLGNLKVNIKDHLVHTRWSLILYNNNAVKGLSSVSASKDLIGDTVYDLPAIYIRFTKRIVHLASCIKRASVNMRGESEAPHLVVAYAPFPKKPCHYIFDDYLTKNDQILIIFGILITQTLIHRTVV